MELKAYVVYVKDQDDDYLDLIKAATPGKAKSSCYFYGDVDFEDIRVKRVPKLDQAEVPFCDQDIFEAGFTVGCVYCHEYLDTPYFDADGFAFCDGICQELWTIKRECR